MTFVGSIAQLVRVPASHAGGRQFEPVCFHQQKAPVLFSEPELFVDGNFVLSEYINFSLSA